MICGTEDRTIRFNRLLVDAIEPMTILTKKVDKKVGFNRVAVLEIRTVSVYLVDLVNENLEVSGMIYGTEAETVSVAVPIILCLVRVVELFRATSRVVNVRCSTTTNCSSFVLGVRLEDFSRHVLDGKPVAVSAAICVVCGHPR